MCGRVGEWLRWAILSKPSGHRLARHKPAHHRPDDHADQRQISGQQSRQRTTHDRAGDHRDQPEEQMHPRLSSLRT
jgi:hypothetical protein